MTVRRVVERAILGDEVKVSRVLAGRLRGDRLMLSRAGETRMWLGAYEPAVQHALIQIPGQYCWDLGAHKGFFTVLLARKGRVLAVEPDPGNFALLEKVVELNGLWDRVVVERVAVSDHVGVGHLAAGPGSDSERRLGDEGEDVEVTTLDALTAKHGAPDVVKMDIEGAEADAFAAAETFTNARPSLVIEAHTPAIRTELQRYLTEHGYVMTEADNSLVAQHRDKVGRIALSP